MGEDKLMLPLGDVPVLLRTLWALEQCAGITEIVVVTREDLIVPVGQLCRDAGLVKVHKVVVGGESRTESVLAGVREADPAAELIAVHDAARPLITRDLLEKVLKTAEQYGAAAPAVPVKDTIKRAVNGVVESTPDRSELYAVQTPQVFEHGLLLGALEKALAEGAELTDDCSAVERLGMSVRLTAGSYENIKLTTPEDLAVAESILERRGAL
ncbi:2-C-methyl-D-erythritol 4-phosphate cytidylyltransferase [Candidatus Pseudoscillospira sp. SGI.172]|uniref:2-C-methyl-D-erythritol 4-phosphate cytidylyltransferase n=1 Tax=Candidatus Pseudoscillospira sp. SGI.172 TaxID=3420582 RepID=UPI002A7C2CCB|nr:2-C-methyl-D-erythritol 4-phosphate cytidylyltransferase [Pseudoflavonifractor sp.]MDY3018980.1 2-C-methyl-D-erythritol 4-phosphate cytidylyltransferase [Oscillospiraceae bacterium]